MSTSPVTTAPMNAINWPRMLVCGLLAGVVWIILGTIVTAVLARDFIALPHNRLASPTPAFVVLNIAANLLTGVSMLWLYAAIRPRYGPGVRTAAIAAFASWFIVGIEDAIWCTFELFPARTIIPLIFGTLPALIIATLIGAKFYKE